MSETKPPTPSVSPVVVGTYTPSTPPDPNAIRAFSDADIYSAMKTVLSSLDPARKGAIVAYADGDDVKAAIFGKLGKHAGVEWSYVGTLGVTYKGKLSGGVGLMGEW
jgi:Icc-related predicted phosphoesterase